MSFIKIRLATDINGYIDMKIKVECTDRELEVATAALVHALATAKGVDAVTEMVEELKGVLDGTCSTDTVKEQ